MKQVLVYSIVLLRSSVAALVAAIIATVTPSMATAAPCMKVTLTGTKGGPAAVNGLAGVGTLVQFGDDSKDCKGVNLQFDVGRATSVRLSQIGMTAGDLNAIFFTHVHSDHTDGFADLMQLRWHYQSDLPKVDIVCSVDAPSGTGHSNSCSQLAKHVADSYIQSGEIAQRHDERKQTPAEGPSALTAVKTFEPAEKPEIVWSFGDVKVWAIRSTHTAGHASYRVDTPAGSVVVSGDASNDIRQPPRAYSTSDQVEMISKGVDILVHATTHPNMGPEKGGGMPQRTFYRQSTAVDIGAMAQRAGVKYLMLTHLTPSLGEVERIDKWKIPGAPLTEKDFRQAVLEGGYKGNIIVGTDLTSIRLPVR